MCAHILVAEDNEMQADLIRRLLVREGHTTVVVHDGRAAIDEAKSRRPDLVVLDLMLPGAEPDRVFSRRQLLHHTRGHDRASTERAIDVHIMNVRKKVEPDPRRPVRLVTVFGVGYKLVGGHHVP
ncbi:winged helix-turn-helix domain-containing protein [Streptomyces avermitilis]|uniref:DNA-binding response regulator n=1 Tax=Streptomyces avermitilis TaxID=33903 RepID=UPI00340D7AE8